MVAPLNDAHVSVSDGDRDSDPHLRPGTPSDLRQLDVRAKAHIVRRDLGGKNPQEYGNGRISYADLPDGQGYLRISGFGGYHPTDRTYARQLAELDRALDAVLTRERTDSLRGLIIDLRVNGGGDDALGVHLAGRLTDTPYLAYRKRTRYTPPQPVRVEPAHDAPRYTGPVAVLTADTTFSAGRPSSRPSSTDPAGPSASADRPRASSRTCWNARSRTAWSSRSRTRSS